MGLKEEIAAQIGDLPDQLWRTAQEKQEPVTGYFRHYPVTAYPTDADSAAVRERLLSEVRRSLSL